MEEETVANTPNVPGVVGEIVYLCAYPENVVDLPEIEIMQQRSLFLKSNSLNFKKQVHTSVCCMTGIEVGRMPTAARSTVCQSSMTVYSNLITKGGENLLLNTIGLFAYLPGSTIPSDVLQYLVDFCSKEMNKERRAATKATKVVVTAAEVNNILLGKAIFDIYSSTRTAVNNQYNLVFREPKSGENITGVVLHVRMTLCRAHEKGLLERNL